MENHLRYLIQDQGREARDVTIGNILANYALQVVFLMVTISNYYDQLVILVDTGNLVCEYKVTTW